MACKTCMHLVYKEENGNKYPWCEKILDSTDIEAERFCTGYKEFNSNADHIRAMSDEELAEFLERFETVCGCDMCNFQGNCHAESECRKGFLEWLKSEVKE